MWQHNAFSLILRTRNLSILWQKFSVNNSRGNTWKLKLVALRMLKWSQIGGEWEFLSKYEYKGRYWLQHAAESEEWYNIS